MTTPTIPQMLDRRERETFIHEAADLLRIAVGTITIGLVLLFAASLVARFIGPM